MDANSVEQQGGFRPQRVGQPHSTVNHSAANSHDCLTVSQPCAQCQPEPDDDHLLHQSASVRANARSCPRTTCNVVTSFARGAEVNVLQRVSGDSVSGNAGWQAVKHNNGVVYIHAPLLSRNRPSPTNTPAPRPAQPAQQQQQPAPVSAPAQPTADTRRAYPGLNCGQIRELNGDGNFTRDHPAYSNRRDGNNDGVACEL